MSRIVFAGFSVLPSHSSFGSDPDSSECYLVGFTISCKLSCVNFGGVKCLGADDGKTAKLMRREGERVCS